MDFCMLEDLSTHTQRESVYAEVGKGFSSYNLEGAGGAKPVWALPAFPA